MGIMVYTDKFLYIHIPKCGGTSIEVALKATKYHNGYGVQNGIALQHLTYDEYVNSMGMKFRKDRISFTTIRHPYKRCISEYYWARNCWGYYCGDSFENFLYKMEYVINNNLYK